MSELKFLNIDDLEKELLQPCKLITGKPSREGLYPWIKYEDGQIGICEVVNATGEQFVNDYRWMDATTRRQVADSLAHHLEKGWFTIQHVSAFADLWEELFNENADHIRAIDTDLAWCTAMRRLGF
ncbi:hypothetical protein [Photobacterium alginatilyticum]|uniref:Uncharacterized protein n=1 Tax=Photobacterium alginatilyticum TaxID=1775171 RepID=A0ABW9YJK0_9GAMM|nr:hypothetical protein [Photobacterium alginatilyticum]NBI53451.1 hypothetical protein [Photobacterium alginatilyticum]